MQYWLTEDIDRYLQQHSDCVPIGDPQHHSHILTLQIITLRIKIKEIL